METMDLLLAIMLGLGLAASTGLNTFLPLLLLGGAARFGIAGVDLGQRFEWLTSDTALIVLIIASIVEIIGDKVPAVDHLLDAFGTFARPAAGTIAAASVLTDLDPMIAAVVGLVVGAPTSLGLHSLKAGTRVASSAGTLGCANPFLSLIEDVLSVALSLIAILLPLLVPVVLIALAAVLWRIARRGRAATTAGG